jgi:hypothetical protein
MGKQKAIFIHLRSTVGRRSALSEISGCARGGFDGCVGRVDDGGGSRAVFGWVVDKFRDIMRY